MHLEPGLSLANISPPQQHPVGHYSDLLRRETKWRVPDPFAHGFGDLGSA
jgi:hypothetical protein